ncbi:cellulose binding domain-containing protein [Catenulispora yoronensis]
MITNPMTVPLNTWALQFTLPTTERITSMWGGTDTASGTTHNVVAQSYDKVIAAGASITIGFDATYSGTFTAPSACQLNNNPCDGTGDTQPPTAPTGLTVLSTTATASLSWTGSTDNVSVAGYKVYSGSTVVATSPAPPPP